MGSWDIDMATELAANEYYQRTWAVNAMQISCEGFRLKKGVGGWGRFGTFKQAIYLTKSPQVAGGFGNIMFKCKLRDGISILRIDEQFDAKVIDYLKREFGKQIVRGDLSQAIPRNKKLTRKELINLVNYRFWKTKGQSKDKDRLKWQGTISSLRQHLVLHKFDAVGETEDLDGVAVFNPSFVTAEKIYCTEFREIEKGILRECKPEKLAQMVKEDIADYRELDDDRSYQEEWDYIENLLQRYCRENKVAM